MVIRKGIFISLIGGLFMPFQSYSQLIMPISKQEFLTGIRPEAYKDTLIKESAFQRGVRINSCLILRNNDSHQYSHIYKAIGLLNNLLIIQRGDAAGVSYLFARKNACMMQKISGFPYKLKDKIVCFNEEQTTDRQDFICVYQLVGEKLILLRKATITHQAFIENIRFSKDGKSVFFSSDSNSPIIKYSAIRL